MKSPLGSYAAVLVCSAAAIGILGLTSCSMNAGLGGKTSQSASPSFTTVTVMPLPSNGATDPSTTIPTSTIPEMPTQIPSLGTTVSIAGMPIAGDFQPVRCFDEDSDGDFDIVAGVDHTTGKVEAEVLDIESAPRLGSLSVESPTIDIDIDDDPMADGFSLAQHAKVTREGNVWILEGEGTYEDDHTRTDHIFIQVSCP